MKIHQFLNRFKIKEESNYTDSKERIMKLHLEQDVFSYVNEVIVEEASAYMKISFVARRIEEGMKILFYDAQGDVIGEGIALEVHDTKDEAPKLMQSDENATVYFQLQQGEIEKVKFAQYISKN